MKKISLLAICLYLFFGISCKKNDVYGLDENDTLRGIFGKIELYDEFGNQIVNSEGVNVTAHCVDTISVDVNGIPTNIYDTVMQLQTDSKGMWKLLKAPSGIYTITFEKDGFCNNQWYKYSYDTSRADTLDILYLCKKTQASIHLESLSLLENVLQIDRTVNFENTTNESYMVSTWYFFDTLPQVSTSKYVYSYVSGASVSQGGTSNRMTIQKPLDKLYEYGIKAGQTVYVTAYTDNAKYVKYKISDTEYVYPNVSEQSNVLSFVLPEE